MTTIPTISDARQQVRALNRALQRSFVGRDEAINMLILTAVAGEPLLLLGPPGTAKTALVKAFTARIGITGDKLFDYLITRYTEPSELLGPIDLDALREGRYIRRTEGKLPTAQMAFIDEIFRANSAILNTLLSVLNERVFYQDGRAEPVETELFVAAANRISDDTELAALRDRFLIKVRLTDVKQNHLNDLLRMGTIQEINRRHRRTIAPMTSLEVFQALRTHVDESLMDCFENDRDDPLFSPQLRRQYERLLISLDREGYASISDRSAVKLYRLIRFNAFLFGSGKVESSDLFLFAYTPAHQDATLALRQQVTRLLEIELSETS